MGDEVGLGVVGGEVFDYACQVGGGVEVAARQAL